MARLAEAADPHEVTLMQGRLRQLKIIEHLPAEIEALEQRLLMEDEIAKVRRENAARAERREKQNAR